MKRSSQAGSTQYEVLLAIAMSELYQTTHVMFMPPGKHYTDMLVIVKNKKLVEPIGEKFYKLTTKGWKKLRSKYIHNNLTKEAEAAIDRFVDKL